MTHAKGWSGWKDDRDTKNSQNIMMFRVLHLATIALFCSQALGSVQLGSDSKLGMPRLWPPDIVIQVPGGLSTNDAVEIVRRRFLREGAALHRCAKDQGGNGDAVAGKAVATFAVLPSGAVQDVTVQGQLAPAVNRCLARRIEGFRLKQFADKKALVRASWVQD